MTRFSPYLISIFFLIVFTFGGTTGILLSQAPLDVNFHDTYYVVGHFHYVLSLGAVYALFAGTIYWYGKFFGKALLDLQVTSTVLLFSVGVNCVFLPMHTLGISGIPRRIPEVVIGGDIAQIGIFGSFCTILSVAMLVKYIK